MAYLSALLIASAFFAPPMVGQTLLLIGFLPFLLFLCGLSPLRKIFYHSFFAGIIFFGITLSWLFATLPLDWAGIDDFWTGFTIFFFVWLLIIVGFGIWWGIFGMGSAWLFSRHKTPWALLLGIPSLWVLTEYLRAFVFGLIWFSPEQSVIGPDWTFSNIAYLVSGEPLGVLARYGGIYVINFFTLFVNVLILLCINRSKWGKTFLEKVFFGGVVVAGALLIGYGVAIGDRIFYFPRYKESQRKSISVAAVSINFPKRFYFAPLEQEQKREKIRELIKTIERKVDIIVLPEIAEFINPAMFQDEKLISILTRFSPLIIDHGYSMKGYRSTPQTSYWRLSSRTFAHQGKALLMPGGEYLPWLLRKGLVLSSNEALVIAYDETRTVFNAKKEPFINDRLGNLSSLLCSEAMSPRIAQNASRLGTELFFLQASDAIFQGNPQYLKQMIAMAQMRAVETGRFIIRSSNGGISAIIDPFGSVVEALPKGEGVLYGEVYPVGIKTLYSRGGDIPLLTVSLFILIILLARSIYSKTT